MAFHRTSPDNLILDNTLINLKFMSAQKISAIHHLSGNDQLEVQFYLTCNHVCKKYDGIIPSKTLMESLRKKE